MFIFERNPLLLWSTSLVFISFVCAYPRDNGERQVNLKIGFDLTQEVNGEPALRIRDFEERDNYPRALDSSEKSKHGHVIRADSFSANSEEEVKDVVEVKEVKKPKKAKRERERQKSSKEGSETDSDDDDERKDKSTKGLRAGEYDADDDAKIHGREADDSEGR